MAGMGSESTGQATTASGGAHAVRAVGLRWLSSLARFSRRKPLGFASLVIILGLCLLAALAPFIAADPTETNYRDALVSPSAGYWFGTDNFGRDVFARVAWGGRISLVIGFTAAAIGYGAGAVIGLVGGFRGGVTDAVLQRTMDTLMAFPRLILALTVVVALGPSLPNLILGIGLASVPEGARVVRSVVLAVRSLEYVQAARALGASDLRIMVRHISPQLVAPFLVVFTAAIGWSILIEAGISFLGFGIQPPTPAWGRMLSAEGLPYVQSAPWLSIFPGMAITLAVYGFNLLGDSLRDVVDPYLRRG